MKARREDLRTVGLALGLVVYLGRRSRIGREAVVRDVCASERRPAIELRAVRLVVCRIGRWRHGGDVRSVNRRHDKGKLESRTHGRGVAASGLLINLVTGIVDSW